MFTPITSLSILNNTLIYSKNNKLVFHNHHISIPLPYTIQNIILHHNKYIITYSSNEYTVFYIKNRIPLNKYNTDRKYKQWIINKYNRRYTNNTGNGTVMDNNKDNNNTDDGNNKYNGTVMDNNKDKDNGKYNGNTINTINNLNNINTNIDTSVPNPFLTLNTRINTNPLLKKYKKRHIIFTSKILNIKENTSIKIYMLITDRLPTAITDIKIYTSNRIYSMFILLQNNIIYRQECYIGNTCDKYSVIYRYVNNSITPNVKGFKYKVNNTLNTTNTLQCTMGVIYKLFNTFYILYGTFKGVLYINNKPYKLHRGVIYDIKVRVLYSSKDLNTNNIYPNPNLTLHKWINNSTLTLDACINNISNTNIYVLSCSEDRSILLTIIKDNTLPITYRYYNLKCRIYKCGFISFNTVFSINENGSLYIYNAKGSSGGVRGKDNTEGVNTTDNNSYNNTTNTNSLIPFICINIPYSPITNAYLYNNTFYICSSSGLISYINNIYSVVEGNRGVSESVNINTPLVTSTTDSTPLNISTVDNTSSNIGTVYNTLLVTSTNDRTPLNISTVDNTPLVTRPIKNIPFLNNTPFTHYPFITSVILTCYYHNNYTYAITPFTLYIIYKGYLLHKINKKITSFKEGLLGTRDGYILIPFNSNSNSIPGNSISDNTHTTNSISDSNTINYFTFKVSKDALTGILLYNKGIYVTSRDGYLYYIDNKDIYSDRGVSNTYDNKGCVNKGHDNKGGFKQSIDNMLNNKRGFKQSIDNKKGIKQPIDIKGDVKQFIDNKTPTIPSSSIIPFIYIYVNNTPLEGIYLHNNNIYVYGFNNCYFYITDLTREYYIYIGYNPKTYRVINNTLYYIKGNNNTLLSVKYGGNDDICTLVEIDSDTKGVNNGSIKQKGVNNQVDDYKGDNLSSIKQRDVNNTSNKQHPFNISADTNTLNTPISNQYIYISHINTPYFYGYITCYIYINKDILITGTDNGLLVMYDRGVITKYKLLDTVTDIKCYNKGCLRNKGGVIDKGNTITGATDIDDNYVLFVSVKKSMLYSISLINNRLFIRKTININNRVLFIEICKYINNTLYLIVVSSNGILYLLSYNNNGFSIITPYNIYVYVTSSGVIIYGSICRVILGCSNGNIIYMDINIDYLKGDKGKGSGDDKDRGSNYKGVNKSTNTLQGVTERTKEQQGVNESTNTLQGVNNRDIFVRDNKSIISGINNLLINTNIANLPFIGLNTYRLHNTAVLGIYVHKNIIVTCSDDHTLNIIRNTDSVIQEKYKINTSKLKWIAHSGRVLYVYIVDEYILSIGSDRYLRVWRIEDLCFVKEIKWFSDSICRIHGYKECSDGREIIKVLLFGTGIESIDIDITYNNIEKRIII